MPILTRRRVLIVAALGGAVATSEAIRYALRPATEGALVTPDEAYRLGITGAAKLVDIRRPDEWAHTGIGEGAHPLDMRRDDFIPALSQLVGNQRDAPVILICAGGVRSRIMAARLAGAGFTRIIDVPEGMLGSRVGVGWIRRGLPLVPWEES